MMDLRATIAAAALPPKRELRPVATPFWADTDGQVFLRMPTAAEWLSPYSPPVGKDGKFVADDLPMWAGALAACLCHADGKPIFGESDQEIAEGARLLAGQRPSIATALFDVWKQLRQWATPKTEDSEKNSETTPPGDLPTDSPPI